MRCREYGIKTRPSNRGKLKEINRALLHKLYVTDQRSASIIAKQLNCSLSSILFRLKRFRIKIRPIRREIKGLNKTVLHRLYNKENKTIVDIANMFSCSNSLIRRIFREYGIQLRPLKRIKGLTKVLLYELYVEKGETIREIAMIEKCSYEVVRRRCKKFGIPLRQPGWRKKAVNCRKTEEYFMI